MAKNIKSELPKIVQEAGEIQLHGTLIDDGWYQHLRFENGVPNMIAILILSEVFYWYRPTVIKDEASGKILEVKKKYHADKLQKDYKSLGERFGVSKRMAQNACYFLRDHGLITIENRTVPVVVRGQKKNLPNITFIEPVLENIRKISCMCKEYCVPDYITFESDIPSEGDIPFESDTPSESDIPFESIPYVPFESDTLHRLPSTENTKPITSLSVCPSVVGPKTDEPTDGLEEILDVLNNEYLKPLEIRPATLKIIEGIITNLYYSTKSTEIGGALLPPKVILKTLKQLTPYCIEHTVNKYEEYSRLNDIRNSPKYLQTVLYNSVYDEGISITSELNYKVHGNGRKRG